VWIQKGQGVTHLAYSPDGRILYAIESGGALTAWDIASRTGRTVRGRRDWWMLTARLFPLADGRRLVWLDGWATVLDANSGDDLGGVRGLTDHKSGLRTVTPDGRVFYLKSGAVAVAAWNLTTREPEPQREVPKAARRGIRSFDISKDEELVALVGLKGAVTVYDWGDGPGLQNPLALDATADDVRFAPDGRTLAVFSGRTVQMWDLSRGVAAGKPVTLAPQPPNETFAFHPAAPLFLALDRDRHLTLFSLETGEPVRSLDFGLGKRVACVAFSPDGLTCAVGGSNKQFAVFDVDV
jgi:WD40 repeat protein